MEHMIFNSVKSDINMCEWNLKSFLYESTIIQQSVLKIALKQLSTSSILSFISIFILLSQNK